VVFNAGKNYDGCSEVRERNAAELHNPAIFQTVLQCHFIRETAFSIFLALLFP
jgi:hypothetical protein